VIVLINTGDVPVKLQEPLSSAANAIVELAPRCTPKLGPAANASSRARTLEAWLKRYSGSG
jgi:hypothetical protein